MELIVITGMSGAGKSHVANYLEDTGFFCVDNLPAGLIMKFVEIALKSQGSMEKIALVADIRSGRKLDELLPELDNLSKKGFKYKILFMEATDNVLVKRYKETRRIHPASPEGRLIEGIKREREALYNIKQRADYIIDTSNLIPRQLKSEVENLMKKGSDDKGFIISILSFGFRYGIPSDCDLVFDVRFLPNPHYVSYLKKLTGKSEAVRDYIFKNNTAALFIEKTTDMLDFLMPHYIDEGKAQLVIGIGCTGGRHRSVAISENIAAVLKERQYRVFVLHRDVGKNKEKYKNEI